MSIEEMVTGILGKTDFISFGPKQAGMLKLLTRLEYGSFLENGFFLRAVLLDVANTGASSGLLAAPGIQINEQ